MANKQVRLTDTEINIINILRYEFNHNYEIESPEQVGDLYKQFQHWLEYIGLEKFANGEE